MEFETLTSGGLGTGINVEIKSQAEGYELITGQKNLTPASSIILTIPHKPNQKLGISFISLINSSTKSTRNAIISFRIPEKNTFILQTIVQPIFVTSPIFLYHYPFIFNLNLEESLEITGYTNLSTIVLYYNLGYKYF